MSDPIRLSDPFTDSVHQRLMASIDASAGELIRFQRAVHRDPELSWEEHATTERIAARLHAAGLEPVAFEPTGLYADLGAGEPACRIGLRADIDALPLQERSGLAWSSRTPGVSHACGHDVHASALLGAAIALAGIQPELARLGIGVRCVFQPAEETHPSGAVMVRDSPAGEGVDAFFALHCDPATDVGRAGLRAGAITAASDRIVVRVRGGGGHTSRPHLTADAGYALACVVTQLPAALTRLVDVRARVLLAWGSIHAGSAENVIPDSGEARGTLRLTDAGLWERIEPLVVRLAEQITAPYGVDVDVEYHQGVPPVINTSLGVGAARLAVAAALGPDAAANAEQSMGGEDFAWLLRGHEGALIRLGTRTPGGTTFDLHRGDLVIDPACVALGARLLATLPFAASTALRGTPAPR